MVSLVVCVRASIGRPLALARTGRTGLAELGAPSRSGRQQFVFNFASTCLAGQQGNKLTMLLIIQSNSIRIANNEPYGASTCCVRATSLKN